MTADDGVTLTPEDRKLVKELVDEVGEDGIEALVQLAQERETWLPSRRDFLKGGAGAGVGVAGLLAASGPASAQDTSTANLGEPGASWDVHVDELLDPQGDLLVDVDDTGTLQFQRGMGVPSLVTGDLNDAVFISPNDTVSEIETKINDNEVVAFHSTEYPPSSTISVTDPGDTKIFGRGAVIKPQQTDGTNVLEFPHSGDGTPSTNNPKQQIVIENLWIEGNGSEGDGITVEGNVFGDTNAHTKLRMREVRVQGVGGHGVVLDKCWASVLSDCVAENNGANGFRLAQANHDVELIACESHRNQQGVVVDAQTINATFEVYIRGGSVENNNAENIIFGGAGTYSAGDPVDGVVYDSGLDNVRVDQAGDDGILVKSGTHNITFEGCVVETCNTNQNSAKAGLRSVSNGFISITGGSYMHNPQPDFAAPGQIRIESGEFSITGVTAEGNPDHTTNHNGIQIAGGKGTISNCHARYNTDHGIVAFGSAEVKVEGCYCYNNGQVSSDGAGVQFDSGQVDSQILGCRCFDDQGTKTQNHGIGVSGSVDNNIIKNNNIRGNINSGINGTTGSNSIVSDNLT